VPFSDELLAASGKALHLGHRFCAECGLKEGQMAWFEEALASGVLNDEDLDALLGLAAREGRLPGLEQLRDRGAPIATAESCPLQGALGRGHAKGAAWLVQHGAEVKGGGFLGTLDDPELGELRITTSTLGLATKLGDAALVTELLARGCDPAGDDLERAEDWVVIPPLGLASTPELVALLLKAGARADEEAIGPLLDADRADLVTAVLPAVPPELLGHFLVVALSNGKHRAAEALVRAGAKTDERFTSQIGELSLLETAIFKNDGPLTRALLESGVAIKRPKLFRPLTPEVREALEEFSVPLPPLKDLHHAVMPGTAADVKAVLAGGASPHKWVRYPVAAMAKSVPVLGAITMRPDQPEIALALLEAGGDPSLALFAAVLAGTLEVAQAAVAKGAKLDGVRPDGMTLLDHAAQEGHTEVARWLLEQGAPLDEKAAVLAVQSGQLETARLLLERHAAPGPVLSALATLGFPAALVEQAANVVRILHQELGGHGAALEDWRRLVHVAARLGHAGLLQSLAREGSLSDSHLGLPEIARERPLHTAIDGGHQEAVEALLRLGADPTGKLLVALRGAPQPGDLVLDTLARAMTDVLGEVPPGYTALPALHFAGMRGNDGILRALLAAGADRDARDSQGARAGDLAPTSTLRDLLRGA